MKTARTPRYKTTITTVTPKLVHLILLSLYAQEPKDLQVSTTSSSSSNILIVKKIKKKIPNLSLH